MGCLGWGGSRGVGGVLGFWIVVFEGDVVGVFMGGGV